LIKLRPSLKLSLAEVHRNILVAVAPHSPRVTELITRLHLMENTLSRGNKPDSIKLLLHILLSLRDNAVLMTSVPVHECPGSCHSLEGNLPTAEYVSMILGMSIRKIITDDINSTVDPSDFKTVLEDCVKIIRQFGVGVFCPVSMLSEVFSHCEPEIDGVTAISSTPKNTAELFSSDAVRFLSDLVLSIQLLCTNCVVMSERVEREEKRQVSNPVANPVVTSETIPLATHSVRGRGSSSSRGRVLGRGAGISTEGSSMFRSSNKIGTTASIPGRGRVLPGRGLTATIAKTDKEETMSVEVSNGAARDPELEKDQIKQIKDDYQLRAACVRELSLKWFVHYLQDLSLLFQEKLIINESSPVDVTQTARRNSPIAQLASHNSQETPLQVDEAVNQEPPSQFIRKRSNSAASVESCENLEQNKHLLAISMPSLIDRLQQFLCCMNLQLSTKINLDIDKMTPIIARDQHLLTTKCLSSLIECLSALCEIDHMIYMNHIMTQRKYVIYSTDMKENKQTGVSFMGSLANNLNAIQVLMSANPPDDLPQDPNQQLTYNGVPLVSSAIDLIEHCLQKALRTPYQESVGLIVEDDISVSTSLDPVDRLTNF
jgi:hypothetical protein